MFRELVGMFKKDDIGNPPYQYEELLNVKDEDIPKYIKKIYKSFTGINLNLKNPKTFSEKIQWLKVYDTTLIKSQLTDKVLVRDFIKEKIGEEYLKPVLWIGKNFDEIPFDTFPDAFIIKANHGCKWHYIIKNKNEYINNNVLMQITKNHFDGWMGQYFYPFAGLEMQYKYIIPQIIAEPLLRDNFQEQPPEIEIYCFNGTAQIFQKIKYSVPRRVSIFDKDFNHIDLKFLPDYVLEQEPADENLKLAVKLSEKLAQGFKLARVDWLIYNNKLYFNEITFTPFSGYYNFEDKKWDLKLGKLLNLRKD